MFEDFILADGVPPKIEQETVDSVTVDKGDGGDDGGAGGNGGGVGSLMDMLPFLLLLAGLFIFMTMGSRKKDKERKQMLGDMKKNDKVRTIGGIVGTVVEVRDKEILVKIDESNNTRVKFVREAIAEILKEKN